VLGLRVRTDRVQAALVSAVKRGLETECTLATHVDEEFAWPKGPPHEVRTQATAAACRAVQALLAKTGKDGAEALCIGLEDPGVWTWEEPEDPESAAEELIPPTTYAPAIDATRLAETTGLSVLDAFAERDLIQGGLGGPLDALPLWFLLRHPFRTRLLVRLDETVRLVYLPAGVDRHSTAGVLAWDVGPGLSLLRALAALITGDGDPVEGEHGNLADGELAECGELRPELLEAWLDAPWFDAAPPRWRPQGVGANRFVSLAREQLGEVECQRHDLLRTAIDLIAESVRLARVRFCPPEPLLDEVLLAGLGRRNRLLTAELARRFGSIPLTTIDDAGLPDGALGPAASAVLAILWLEQIPANLPAVTGVSVPRVLGRLTPGTPQNWNRLVRELAAAKGTRVSLRSAL
jgi:1,6-anhydro-N-acetylmuramate kinase